MKIGSKVVCVSNELQNKKWMGTLPTIGETYTIRDDCPIDILGVRRPAFCLLEELRVGKEGAEAMYSKKWFRDLDEIGGTSDEILQKAVLGEDEVGIKQVEEQELATV